MSLSKSNKKGILLPPAVGYSFKILVNLIRRNKIHIKYYPRILAIVIINLINFPFRAYERLIINPRFKKRPIITEPIFIIGHWRSGTTHLHNLLCQDAQMGYVTTYQSVFPDTLYNKIGRFLFKGFSVFLIPGKREGDNVILGPSLPQEEEFALGDKIPISFYYFWMFPKNILKYYDQFIRFKNVNSETKTLWQAHYKLLIKKALKNTNRPVFLSKNPPNTARIKVLLEMFPQAKFIHIHRNPIEVFLSTQNFYKKMLPHLRLQNIGQEEIDRNILEIYKNLMKDFFEQKNLISAGNLTELSFEELESDTFGCLDKIYEELSLNGIESAMPEFKKYIESMGNYKKNRHKIPKKLLDTIVSEWGFAMKKLKYEIPKNVEIIDE